MSGTGGLFELVEKGVRVVYVLGLREGWIYLKDQKLLLLQEGIDDLRSRDVVGKVLAVLTEAQA